MTYSVTLQYKIEADGPIEAQQKAIENEVEPSNVTCREMPTRPQINVTSKPVPAAVHVETKPAEGK